MSNEFAHKLHDCKKGKKGNKNNNSQIKHETIKDEKKKNTHTHSPSTEVCSTKPLQVVESLVVKIVLKSKNVGQKKKKTQKIKRDIIK